MEKHKGIVASISRTKNSKLMLDKQALMYYNYININGDL